jgi:hypothetical protein
LSDAIFIAGYYRSGTSALAGALQRLGVSLHNDAEPNEHNPLGFYEIPELIEWDVNLFSYLGVDWTDIRGLPDGWWERADLAKRLSGLEEILRRRFSQDALWGLKHPHLCRLFPLYERAVAQTGHKLHVIHICRAPWTVAASQHKKNGLARAHALLLWLSYLFSAERHARYLPRSWLTYQDMLSDPQAQFKRIERDLGLELCNRVSGGLDAAREFLTDQLNRSEPVPQDDLFRPLKALTERVWDAIQARDFSPGSWDGFAVECADIVGFLSEIGSSRGPIMPGFGNAAAVAATVQAPDRVGLRPAERLDDGARERLLALRAAAPALPSLDVLIAAPPNRAHAINETLESLRAQWHGPAQIRIVSADPVEIADHTVITASAEAGALTRILCEETNATTADYVALVNAGDTLAPDACLRFALAAGRSQADMLYCDEVVQNDSGNWIRHKPAWDVTRLRQAAYLGDWIWYRVDTLKRLGGFDPERAGAEEYDYQLRLAECDGRVERLAEALFTRASLSRRDNIPSTIFGGRATEAVAAHLERAGIPGTVQPRQYLGLFRHVCKLPDPGTSIIMLCSGAEVPMLDRWMKDLLTNTVLTGPIVLAGADLPPQTANYLKLVSEQTAALEGKVLAVPPAEGLHQAEALRRALAMVSTENVAIVDARALPGTPDWAEELRARFADPGVVLAGARTLVPLANENKRFLVQGPIIIGADTRLGAGHMADDPGPGGWLAVDQEASAVAPPALLARRDRLAACNFAPLAGDALWIDLCAQLRAAGGRIVWTPDVSFIGGSETTRVDAEGQFRNGTAVARALSWEDPYHHPALSLRGDLLLAEGRLGLVRAVPADPHSVLLTGAGEPGLLNAARAIRGLGTIEASWAPEPLSAADIGRRAPNVWVRINPEVAAAPTTPPYTAVFTQAPKPEMQPAIAGAAHLLATSPALVQRLRALAPAQRQVELWRPALHRPLWEHLPLGTGLNTNPRVLWIDEGIAPPWFTELLNEMRANISWIVVERPGAQYNGAIARLRRPEHEQGWAHELGALAPHILVRPAGAQAEADHYNALMAAAAGCHLLVDERFDMPASLGAVALPNDLAAWRDALQSAVGNLKATLELGQRARAACLALPTVEEVTPWLEMAAAGSAARRAAE